MWGEEPEAFTVERTADALKAIAAGQIDSVSDKEMRAVHQRWEAHFASSQTLVCPRHDRESCAACAYDMAADDLLRTGAPHRHALPDGGKLTVDGLASVVAAFLAADQDASFPKPLTDERLRAAIGTSTAGLELLHRKGLASLRTSLQKRRKIPAAHWVLPGADVDVAALPAAHADEAAALLADVGPAQQAIRGRHARALTDAFAQLDYPGTRQRQSMRMLQDAYGSDREIGTLYLGKQTNLGHQLAGLVSRGRVVGRQAAIVSQWARALTPRGWGAQAKASRRLAGALRETLAELLQVASVGGDPQENYRRVCLLLGADPDHPHAPRKEDLKRCGVPEQRLRVTRRRKPQPASSTLTRREVLLLVEEASPGGGEPPLVEHLPKEVRTDAAHRALQVRSTSELIDYVGAVNGWKSRRTDPERRLAALIDEVGGGSAALVEQWRLRDAGRRDQWVDVVWENPAAAGFADGLVLLEADGPQHYRQIKGRSSLATVRDADVRKFTRIRRRAEAGEPLRFVAVHHALLADTSERLCAEVFASALAVLDDLDHAPVAALELRPRGCADSRALPAGTRWRFWGPLGPADLYAAV